MSGALARATAQIRLRPSRLVGTLLAVAIGIGFACAAVVFTATYHADLAERVGVTYSRADVVVTPTTDRPTARLAADIAAVPGVAAAEPLYQIGAPYAGKVSHGYLDLAVVPDATALRWMTLTSGSWPSGPDQIAVTAAAAIATHLSVGSSARLTAVDGDQRAVTVVGIVDPARPTAFPDASLGFGAPALFSALGGDDIATIAVLATPGTSASELADTLAARLAAGAIVRTSADQATADIAGMVGTSDAISVVLLGFAAVALTVAGLVIANTVTILLTQRRRQIALLRCVGATREQVRGEILGELALVGVAGSLAGALLGVGAGSLAASITGLDSAGLRTPALPLAIAALVGVLLTVLAGIAPSWRATTVAPVTALRPSDPADLGTGLRRTRVVGGVAVEAAGIAGLLGGIAQGSLELAMLGGIVSAIGVLLLTRVVLPPVLRGLGVLARRWGVTGALAAANARRNPGRSAAASTALIVGVGLIVMLQVAAASVQASTDRSLAQRYPVDVTVDAGQTALPAAVRDGAGGISEVAGAVPIAGVPVTLDASVAASVGAGQDIRLVGVPDQAAAVVRGGLDAIAGSAPTASSTGSPAGPSTEPSPGASSGSSGSTSAGSAGSGSTSAGSAGSADLPVVEVPTWFIGNGAVTVGGTLTVTVDGRPRRFTVAAGHLGDAGGYGVVTLVTSAATLRTIAPAAPTVAVWAALASDADPVAVTADLNSLVGPYPQVTVGGSADDRASMGSVLATLTAVATGLLAVAVVIAIVGIGTTIGLSVVERTRESALLRALGLHRRQLRASLAVEALLLAVLGAGVGAILGVGYGWAGAAATFRMAGHVLVLEVPWTSIAAVLALAVLAGVLASVLPGRRAARAHPVEALADE